MVRAYVRVNAFPRIYEHETGWIDFEAGIYPKDSYIEFYSFVTERRVMGYTGDTYGTIGDELCLDFFVFETELEWLNHRSKNGTRYSRVASEQRYVPDVSFL